MTWCLGGASASNGAGAGAGAIPAGLVCRRRDPPDSLAFHPVRSLVSPLQPRLPAVGLAALQVRGENRDTAEQKVINRSGVAGAVLQTPSSFTD